MSRIDAMIAQAVQAGVGAMLSSVRMDRRDVLDRLLVACGPGCSLELVTWTIGLADCLWLEEQVRTGRIAKLRIVADVSTRSKTPERYTPLARIGQVIDIGDVHAKMAIVESEDGSRLFAEISSANLNHNRRAGAWSITTNRDVIQGLRADLDVLVTTTLDPPLQVAPPTLKRDLWAELRGLL